MIFVDVAGADKIIRRGIESGDVMYRAAGAAQDEFAIMHSGAP
jgi:hypothetical protein